MQDNRKQALLREHFTFWDKLTAEQQELLTNNSCIRTYKKGENVHSGDGSCIGAILVLSGTLRAYLLSETGREVTLHRIKAGEMTMLAASCAMPSMTFDAVVDSEEISEILLVRGHIYEQVAEQNIDAENFALNTAVKEFSDVIWIMQQIMFMSLDRRIAVFLWEEMNKTNSTTLYITHDQLAKYISSAREVVTRMLKYFASEGIVELLRGGIKILDRDKLRTLAYTPQ